MGVPPCRSVAAHRLVGRIKTPPRPCGERDSRSGSHGPPSSRTIPKMGLLPQEHTPKIQKNPSKTVAQIPRCFIVTKPVTKPRYETPDVTKLCRLEAAAEIIGMLNPLLCDGVAYFPERPPRVGRSPVGAVQPGVTKPRKTQQAPVTVSPGHLDSQLSVPGTSECSACRARREAAAAKKARQRDRRRADGLR
jgi:hypothetical protein